MRRNLELENWLTETTGEEMIANHLGPNWNRFNEDVGFYPNMTITVADQVWQHQQSKVDELQKQRDSFIKAYEIEMDKSVELQKNNAWLSGVACRENKRANKLQEEKVSTTTLLGKTIQEKNELQKRVDIAFELIDKIKAETKYQDTYDSLFKLEQALKGEQP